MSYSSASSRQAARGTLICEISLLCILSKVFEKVMYSFPVTFKILFENIFLFRKQHSSHMALMVIIDKLLKSTDNGDYIIGVYF